MHERTPPRATLREMRDAELIALCLTDVAQAWDALIDRYAPLIYTVARRAGLSKQDAEDLFQEVCLQLYDHLSGLRDVGRLSAWLVTTTRRAVWRARRKEKAPSFSEVSEDDWELEAALPVGAAQPDTPEQALLEVERRWRVRECLRQLSPLCRGLLEMLYGRDPAASYTEVARELKMAVNSVGPNRARCLEHLRKKIHDDSI